MSDGNLTRQTKGWPSAVTPFTFSLIQAIKLFSVWAVCESCIEPIPSCSHGEILAVDLNTTNSCCPQYHCGKPYVVACVNVCVFASSKSYLCFLQCIAVCDVSLCPESSVSCAPGLSLVQTAVPGHCCPQYHCGTQKTCTPTHYMLPVSIPCIVDDCIDLESYSACRLLASKTLHYPFLSHTECQCEDSSLPVCQVVSQQKNYIKSHCLIRFLPEGQKKWENSVKSALCFLSGGGAGWGSWQQHQLWLSSAYMPYVQSEAECTQTPDNSVTTGSL